METTRDSLIARYVKIFGVVALYWFVSISMVFVNKSLLGGKTSNDKDAPMFVTWFQCIVTLVCCLIFSRLSKMCPGKISFPELSMVEKNKALKILPLTLVFVSMIALNNLCLKFVGVAFYYVSRSMSTVFNVIFTFFILGQRTSMTALMCCGIIIGGFCLGVDQEGLAGSLSVVGVIFGVSGSAAVALYSIFTKKTLPIVDDSIWRLTYYNNLLACFLFLPLIVITGELPAVISLISDSSLHYWMLMVISGFFGVAIGYVTSLQIQVTSPLTHTISGTAKACAQTVLATWWYMESKSTMWWMSNVLVLGGSMAYTRVKQLEMKNTHSLESVKIHSGTTPSPPNSSSNNGMKV